VEKIDINEVLKEALFNDIDIEQPEPIITIDNKIIATLQNFICISGLPKSRKTTFVNYLIGAGLSGKSIFNMSVNISKNDKIILVDTEQSIFDFSKQIKLLKYAIKSQKLPDNFSAYLFRKYEPDTILNSIYILISEQRPKILVIDNLTELVINPNDMIESKKVIQFLKKITAEFNLVVICLLHLAKTNLQTLGNLGSYTDRGAQSVLKVTLDKETQTSTLEPQLMRSDSFFNPITIYFNTDTKQYEQTTGPAEKVQKSVINDFTDTDHYNRLSVVFRDIKELTYSELVENIKQVYGVGTNKVKQIIIPYLVGNKFLIANKGIYKFS
jgi:KaiC/GvpD/RAD55 family RecA-like ATPase